MTDEPSMFELYGERTLRFMKTVEPYLPAPSYQVLVEHIAIGGLVDMALEDLLEEVFEDGGVEVPWALKHKIVDFCESVGLDEDLCQEYRESLGLVLK